MPQERISSWPNNHRLVASLAASRGYDTPGLALFADPERDLARISENRKLKRHLAATQKMLIPVLNFGVCPEKGGAADRTRTYDPIITNDVLYQLSYSGILLCVGPTMALLVLLLCLEPFGFASHSRGDPLITNDVLYHLSYSGVLVTRLLASRFTKRKPYFSRYPLHRWRSHPRSFPALA